MLISCFIGRGYNACLRPPTRTGSVKIRLHAGRRRRQHVEGVQHTWILPRSGERLASSRRYSRIFSDTYFFLPSLFSSKDDELSDLKLKRLFLFLFGILIIE